MHRACRRVLAPVAVCLALCGAWSTAFGETSDSLQQQILAGLIRGQDVKPLMTQLQAQGRAPHTPLPRSDLTQQLHASELQLMAVLQVTTSSSSASVSGISQVMDAYAPYQALVLLQEDNFASTAKMVTDKGVGGKYLDRVNRAQAAFEVVASLVRDSLSPCQAALASVQNKPENLDQKGLVTCGSGFTSALAALKKNQLALTPHILRSNTLPFRSAQLTPRALPTTPAIQPAYLNGPAVVPAVADSSSSIDAPICLPVGEHSASSGDTGPAAELAASIGCVRPG